jgi:UDP-3-O-[3-hydroxymyristoyl] glucosamine N-acyltransferase
MRLADIARVLGAEVEGDGTIEITGVAALEDATPGTISFLADRRLEAHLATTKASALVLAPGAPPVTVPVIRAPHPYLAFVRIVELFHPVERPPAGVHPTAVVDPTAEIGEDAVIGPHVVVGPGVRLGRNAVLHARVTIYPGARIGDDFTAHAGVVVRESVRIGDRVTLHAGAIVGSDGFGYLPTPTGARKIPQVGTVTIEDDVEVGANSTVDRAALGTTHIGRGTKIDNLVMIAHGCHIGPSCLLAAQTGLAGGTRLGTGVMLGGQVGSAGHLTIGDGAQVAAQSGIHSDIPAGTVWGGYPAMDVRLWRRVTSAVMRLPELLRRVRRLERAVGTGSPDDAG